MQDMVGVETALLRRARDTIPAGKMPQRPLKTCLSYTFIVETRIFSVYE